MVDKFAVSDENIFNSCLKHFAETYRLEKSKCLKNKMDDIDCLTKIIEKSMHPTF